MAGVGAPWSAMESSPERGRRRKGKEERGRDWSAAGGLGLLLLCPWSPPASCSIAAARLLDVRRSRGEERKEKREKKKREKKKRKKMLNLEILGEKNKR
jgi:hypothetical protein